MRGSYITALDRKYHVDHFTCSLCSTIFGAQDSYYEHEGNVYCHYHYSTRFAQRCNGCQTAILKQFVEIFRNGQNQHWHPECYMIHKFWNVRLGQPSDMPDVPPPEPKDEAAREFIRVEEERMEDKVYRIWSVLSTFEESSAACISDMLLHVSNGAYVDGVLVAKRFIWHVEILFQSADRLDQMVLNSSEKGKPGHGSLMMMQEKVEGVWARARARNAKQRQPMLTLNLLIFRSFLRTRGETSVQEDCLLLFPSLQDPRNDRTQAGRYPRASLSRHGTCSLPQVVDQNLSSRCLAPRA